MRMKALFGLILPLLFSCNAPGDHYSVHIDWRFSAQQINDIRNGLTAWENGVAPNLIFDQVMDSNCTNETEPYNTICIHYSSMKELASKGGATPTTRSLGFTWMNYASNSSDVFLAMDDPDMQPSTGLFYGVSSHEIGHAIGLSHTSVGLMFWLRTDENAANFITDTDVNQFLYLRGLTSKKNFTLFH